MSNLFKSKFLLGVMLVAVLVVGGAIALVPTTTHAQQAIITVSDIQYAATVKLGSSGQAALIWQRFLNGYSTTAQLVEDGKFGPLSTAQAKAWQTNRGLVADGVLGTMSRAAAMAQIASNTPTSVYPLGCTSNTGYSATTGIPCAGVTYPAGCTATSAFSSTTGLPCTGTVVTTLPAGCTATSAYSSTTGLPCTGTVGSISGEGSLTVSLESSPSNNTAITYSTTASVMAVKIKATSSAMTINRVDFNFNKRAWLYTEKAGLYDGTTLISEKVLTASSFDEITAGSNYRLRFDGLSYVVAKDATKVLTLKLTAPSIISNPGAGNLVIITFATDSIRATDSTGLITYDGAADTRTFYVSTTTGGVLTATSDTTSPKAGTAIVSATDTTSDVTLLVSGLKATGDAVHVTAIPYVVTVVNGGTGAGVVDVVNALHLYKNGVLLGAGTYEAACTTAKNCIVTFTGLDETIAKDATAVYTIKGDLKPISAVVLAGSTVQVTMTVGGTMIAEDSDYTVVTSTGASIGLAQHLFVKAPIVTLVSAPTPTVTTSGVAATQTGTFTINFSVKAQGSDIYIDPTTTKLSSANATAVTLSYDALAGTPSVIVATSATLGTNNMYKVVDGTTETFTLTGVIVGGAAFTNLQLTGLGFAITDATEGTAVVNWGLTDFKTPNVYLAA